MKVLKNMSSGLEQELHHSFPKKFMSISSEKVLRREVNQR